MKGVSEGDDWIWCFADDAPIREAGDGWETYDAFAEAGVPVMAAHIAAGASHAAARLHDRRRVPARRLGRATCATSTPTTSSIPPTSEAIEAIPGWSWGGG